MNSNFKIESMNGKELSFGEAGNEPFKISGFNWFEKDRVFCRLPPSCLPGMSEGVRTHAWHTSGGRIRFRTDSKTIAIRARRSPADDDKEVGNMPRSGTSGFDFYLGKGTKSRFFRNFCPDFGAETIEGLMATRSIMEPCSEGPMQEWTVYFPLRAGVKNIQIGFEPPGIVEPPSSFTLPRPLVFYGSSITQGACAGRPGNSYTNIIGRWMDADLLNFGFGGSAKGEVEMAELLAELEMSVFIMDYDHNATDAEYLAQTHEGFYRIIRDKKPDLPVIFISKPDAEYDSCAPERREVIKKTYEKARKKNENVFFIDGENLYGKDNSDA